MTEYLFSSVSYASRHISESTANVALRRTGFKGRLVAHGLRSIARATLNEKGFDADVIEAALSHVDKNEVRAAYNHAEYLESRTIVLTAYLLMGNYR